MRWLVVGGACACACGSAQSPSSAPRDAGAASDAPSSAAGPGLPRMQSEGGPVLASPRATLITFAGDENAARMEQLVAGLGGTDHWRAVAGEYGVGALAAAPPVHLAEQAPVTLDSAGVKALLAQQLDGAHELGKPDAGTIYVLELPKQTSVTGALGNGCTDFGGYHAELAVGGVTVPYAVVPTCASYLGVQGADSLGASIAHELIEASTDPFPTSAPAYDSVDAAHAAWPIALGGFELADMCARGGDAFYTPAGFPFVLPRSWSNAAAGAGRSPCAPAVDGPYFVSLVDARDDLALSVAGKTQHVLGVRVAVGATKSVRLVLQSDAAAGPWTIAAVDAAAASGGAASLAFALDKTAGSPGDAVTLAITVNARGALGYEPFFVRSTLGGRTTTAVGVVGP